MRRSWWHPPSEETSTASPQTQDRYGRAAQEPHVEGIAGSAHLHQGPQAGGGRRSGSARKTRRNCDRTATGPRERKEQRSRKMMTGKAMTRLAAQGIASRTRGASGRWSPGTPTSFVTDRLENTGSTKEAADLAHKTLCDIVRATPRGGGAGAHGTGKCVNTTNRCGRTTRQWLRSDGYQTWWKKQTRHTASRDRHGPSLDTRSGMWSKFW